MASGGARARSGPAPDPNALRRDRKDDAAGWEILPAEGRTGAPPAWPLVVLVRPVVRTARNGEHVEYDPRELHARELELWAKFWAMPQAIVWERDHLVHVVGLFVRQFAEGELPHSSAENRKTIKMYFADLYLTSDSLVRARLKIGKVEPERARSFRKTATTSHLSVIVPPDDAA